MQDRYAGDVGDFSKYVLLRALVRATGWRCGIVWYLYPCESHTNDGKFIDYFHRPEFTCTDGDALSRLASVAQGIRSVAALEAVGLLPPHTRHHSDRLHPKGDRNEWFANARAAVEGCDLVMCDPDNGIVSDASFRPQASKAGKYITLGEIAELSKGCRCLVVYHHFSRQGSHLEQMERWLSAIQTAVPQSVTPFALRYRRFSPRAYFVLPMDVEAAGQARSVAQHLTKGVWSHHFELFSTQVEASDENDAATSSTTPTPELRSPGRLARWFGSLLNRARNP